MTVQPSEPDAGIATQLGAPLPQLSGDRLFICDGGIETTLIFEHGIDLPCFAAFPLVMDDAGRNVIRDYFAPFVSIARRHAAGFLVDTVTWRASPDWGERLGFDARSLVAVNRASIALAIEVRESAQGVIPVVINGVVGPRDDGYTVGEIMSAVEAERYHAFQIDVFAGGAVDMVTALTLTYADEAVGVVRAAVAAGLPVAISFTVETNGRLPSGQRLADAIEHVDAETDGAAAYFMINCAHPSHFAGALGEGGEWTDRVRGIRANASRKSHAELDASGELDPGDPTELADEYRNLRSALPALAVLGGCCGTDHRHIAAICQACTHPDSSKAPPL